MRRLFARQATVTPFDDTHSQDAGQQRVHDVHFDERGDWSHVSMEVAGTQENVQRSMRTSYLARRSSGSAPQTDDNGAPAGSGRIVNGYPSYGEEHTATNGRQSKGKLSRHGSMSAARDVGPTAWSSKTSNPFQKRREQPTAQGEWHAYTDSLSSQMDDPSSHLGLPPHSGKRDLRDGASIPYQGRGETDTTHFLGPLPNPHDQVEGPRGTLGRRTSSEAGGFSVPQHPTHAQWSADGNHASNERYGGGQEATAWRPYGYVREERAAEQPGTAASHLQHPSIEIPSNFRSQTGMREVYAERPQERYVDQYDEHRVQDSGREAGKDRVKRILFGRKKQQDRVEKQHEGGHEDSDEGSFEDKRTSLRDNEALNRSGRSSPKKGMESMPPAWLDWKGLAKVGAKSEAGAIPQQIAWLCSQDEQIWSQEMTKPLFDAVSRSEAASKEAAKALRKELKSGANEQTYHAVKLWALFFRHTGDRFKLQLANKRFLEALEDLYSDKRTSTQTRGRLLVGWSMLAHESQSDADLQPITKMFNKMKPGEMPTNGVPLDPDNDLFHTADETTQTTRVTLSAPLEAGDDSFVPLPPDENLHVHTDTESATRKHEHVVQQAARHADDLHRLHEECNVARSNAQLLTETLIEDGLDALLLPEFAEKTRLSHDFISAQIPWASSQAEMSRQRSEDRNKVKAHAAQSGMTPEEALLQDLLDAHEKVVSVQGMIQEAEDRRREEAEEAQILDRSMREMRMDRSALVHDPETGNVYHYEDVPRRASMEETRPSGSRSVSPARRPLPEASTNVDAMQTQGGLLAPPMQVSLSSSSAPVGSAEQLDRSSTTASAPSTGNRTIVNQLYRGGPRPMQSQAGLSSPGQARNTPPAPPPRLLPDSSTLASGRAQNQQSTSSDGFSNKYDESSDIMTPIQPSEKALGKRRAVSIHGSSPTTESSEAPAPFTIPPSNATPDREDKLLTRPPPALPP